MGINLFSFDNESKGILQTMSGSTDYWKLFTFSATSWVEVESGCRRPSNAFNFSNSNYWIGDNAGTPAYLTFCFKHFWVLPKGYQITTTGEDSARAKEWTFSGSNDNKTWENTQTIDHELNPYETHYFAWSPNAHYRCFKITTLNSTNKMFPYRFDIVNIDIFGNIIQNHLTCNQQLFNRFAIATFLLLSLSLFIS